jgi:hypothetical protein
VLFSNDHVSAAINRDFEPAWQSVRPAAIIRIDFGNGRSLTRTLNGNVATCVCRADGTVLDVIPGLYDPATYRERLAQAVLLHRWATERSNDLDAFLKDYHGQQARSLREHKEPLAIVTPGSLASIVQIETGMKLVVRSAVRGPFGSGGHDFEAPRGTPARPQFDLPPDLVSRMGRVTPEMLAEDVRQNESARRLKIHERLASVSPVRPAEFTKWLYREVLATDLDDPYLGLGKLLFATYPFAAEDDAWRADGAAQP